MPQASDSTVWVAGFVLLAFALAFALGVVLVALGQLALERRAPQRPYWHAGVSSAALAGLLAAGSGASEGLVGASIAGALLGAWLVHRRNLMRQPCLIALLGSGVGLAVMTLGFARYLRSAQQLTAQANVERFELYAAVFMGALIFATSAVALCKLRGFARRVKVTSPGHDVVSLCALLLCGWLGYGFVTEQTQPFGLAALLAMSLLSCSMGAHLMLSRESSNGSILHDLSRIEWRGADTQAWVMREPADDGVRGAACRARRGWHSGACSNENHGASNDRRRVFTRRRSNHARIIGRR